MVLVVDLLEARACDVGVDLGRRDIRVAEHHLDRAEVRAMLEQVRGERMPEDVRGDVGADPRFARVPGDLEPYRLAGETTAPDAQKKGWVAVAVELGPSALHPCEDRVPG